ncbi:hypothetical protein ASF10_21390 [Flavobacterium sp. Leaf82]|nr:hypothetical protein ASF10_21390 [Flavobacterium sp. Leaf82]
MITKNLQLKTLIGNTPIIKLEKDEFNLYIKLEQYNLSGSVKDRAVNHILEKGILENKINSDTVIIESSSGNFAYSAALHCKYLGIKFIAVVDLNINTIMYEKLKSLCHDVIQITEKDETGGYLLNRIKIVKSLVSQNENYFWTNQYANVNNYLAYSELTNEIIESVKDVDYIFVAVSTTGTIKGVSTIIKAINKNIKIIAVDIRGSMIFSTEKCSRNIPGIGASKESDFLELGDIDDFIILDEKEIIEGCQSLLAKGFFLGGSSGACYQAVIKYNEQYPEKLSNKNIVFISPDGGGVYVNNIYK